MDGGPQGRRFSGPCAAPRGVPALEKAADCARPGMPLYSSAWPHFPAPSFF
ncbi:hypothetical protein BURPS1710A_1605 [Burkholderia pseudomallei 1710a]|uniref:Uncharacterized protein n=1 Tax=Burkholderia pseudomallei 1710a TaxID=320371 RepID=A0A0E1WG29_BURPE|nr:hypothetical protein BURPS1710A_1605 [Burkholderia pseudomallei 1710a]